MNEWMNKGINTWKKTQIHSNQPSLAFLPSSVCWENDAEQFLLDYLFKKSLNTCLQMTSRKTEMETSRKWLGKDGTVVLAHTTSRCHSGLLLKCFSFFFFFRMLSPKNVIHFKAQKKCWPHAVQLGDAWIWCNAFKYKANGCEDLTHKSPIKDFFFKSALNVSEMETSIHSVQHSAATWPSASSANFTVKAKIEAAVLCHTVLFIV